MRRLAIRDKWLVISLSLVAMLILVGCRTLPIATDNSVIVKEYTRDTIMQYKLEREVVERQVEITDTVYLENKYSQAKAWVVENKIYGKLQTRDTSVAVALKYPCKMIATTKTNVVEINKLQWWQEALMWLGGLCMVCLVAIIAIKFFKR